MKYSRDKSAAIRNMAILFFAALSLSFGLLFYAESKNAAEEKQFLTDRIEALEDRHTEILDDVETNLQDLTSATEKKEIDLTKEEDSKSTKQQLIAIGALMQAINLELIDLKKKNLKKDDRIVQLQEDIQKSSANSGHFKKQLDEAKKQIKCLEDENLILARNIDSSEQYITELSYQIEALNSEIEWYFDVFNEKEGKLVEQEAQLRKLNNRLATTYYIVDTEKNLKKSGVLERSFISGLTGVNKINADLKQTDFYQINKNVVTQIPVYAKKAELISVHPSDSYEWEFSDDGISYLKITDPAQFWKFNPYLIISTQGPKFTEHESEIR